MLGSSVWEFPRSRLRLQTVLGTDEQYPDRPFISCFKSVFHFDKLLGFADPLSGEGNFGKVWKAEADDICGYDGTILVAVKTVKVTNNHSNRTCGAASPRRAGNNKNQINRSNRFPAIAATADRLQCSQSFKIKPPA